MSTTHWMLGLLAVGLFAPAVHGDEPAAKLPKVVLIGDSIRLSYTPEVTRQLQGQAVIVSPSANGQDSSNLLKHLTEWVIREQPDVVHFNCGIHDTKKFAKTGTFQVSPEDYEKNLRAIVERIRKETKATTCFATSTPILDDRAAAARAGRDYQLLGSSIEQYNAIAIRVMRALNVPVNDLRVAVTTSRTPLTTEALLGSDGVHFTAAGVELLGKQVAGFLRERLAEQGRD